MTPWSGRQAGMIVSEKATGEDSLIRAMSLLSETKKKKKYTYIYGVMQHKNLVHAVLLHQEKFIDD